MISSNFGLPELLEKSGIPRAQVGEYQKLIQMYWEGTYGPTIRKFRNIYPHLKELRDCLEVEVEMIRKVPNALYLEGIDEVREIHVLFDKEKAAFYKLVQEWMKGDYDDHLSNLEAFFDAQLFKAQEWAKSLIKILRADLKHDLKNATSTGWKILVVLQYTLGALKVALKIKSFMAPAKLGVWALGKGIKAMNDRWKLEAKLKGLETRSKQIQAAAKELILEGTEEVLKKGLSNAATIAASIN